MSRKDCGVFYYPDQHSDGGGSGLHPGAERASAPAAVPMDGGEMNELPTLLAPQDGDSQAISNPPPAPQGRVL